MTTFELTGEEALSLIEQRRGPDDWNRIFIKNRPHDCTFHGTIRGFAGKEVFLTCKGDELGSVFFYETHNMEDGYELHFCGDSFVRIPPNNRSFSQCRLGIPDYTGLQERALHNLWQDKNKEHDRWVGDGWSGLLQTLFNGRSEFHDKYLTNRERRIVATIVQWFGTNCGRAFLNEAEQLGKDLAKNNS